MATFRIHKSKDNPYALIDKTMLNDSALSWKAKGVLSYLLSLPDDWKIYDTEVAEHSKDGLDSLRSGIRELIEAGYIEKWQQRGENGAFTTNSYNVYERSILTNDSDVTVGGEPVHGEPVNGKPVNGKSHSSNKEQVNTEKSNKEKEIEKNNVRLHQQTLIPKGTVAKAHKTDDMIFSEITDYLNKKTSRQYNNKSANMKKFISARVNEGHTLDNFKHVIDVKVAQWLGDDKMEQYLRPETLFGTKFNSYLAEKMPTGRVKGKGKDVESIDQDAVNRAKEKRTGVIDDEVF